MRKKYTAAVCVYRQGARQTLEADIHTKCGKSWWMFKCPKVLQEVAFQQRRNAFEVEFTCEENGLGICGVKFIRTLTDSQYRDYRIKAA